MSIGERIKQRRKLLQITQLEIAEQLKMGRSNFGHIENGRVTPSSSDLQKIADILQTNADYLLGRTDDPSPQGAAAGLKTYPEWATSKDKRDLKKMLQSPDVLYFDGIEFSDEDRAKMLGVMETIFWEAKKMNKEVNRKSREKKNNRNNKEL
ncbi:helix-turn-helix family protein [Paenibacillus larvae subsp. larvae]|uniref:Helix-turn-helix family protein n=1 Tax=Paenibacillus larvae subsp. larvae TaxID=147375 RepID=A0A2L1TXA8_9BACL|nr:helix-turn-helix transcriptional regulator [Paenibacillus larvae]AQT85884.1 hypothetical protein B1222_18035 [Paenibacillus larvae subsp. pulvifaciens]AQZ45878.1 hypothetical protein B5S25_03950 [Paenibacillus larvae subsp. pulvifaciens]AVF25315.1 helix-turn-helix family protein [Paenibacillus larvae subsp. larvae]AVF30092.1 helix-turn-helix family protein [Paenibacillus larvae subsp. larvae]MBH0344598.1 hypothetical protein [Paenibacillus larvae]